ncbi:hypothetical protein HanRHA438_Chr12g0576051 [Helianthus annuus]|nr:hypothetical protein HanRHA438_Chr12g0576051 [Helianthus annuus]
MIIILNTISFYILKSHNDMAASLPSHSCLQRYQGHNRSHMLSFKPFQEILVYNKTRHTFCRPAFRNLKRHICDPKGR